MILFSQPGELFANFAFKATLGRRVVARLRHFRRKIDLTCRIGMRFVMGIAVLFAQPHLFHQPGRRVAQMLRHVVVGMLARIAHCRFKGVIDGVAFRRAGEIDDRLSDSAFPFGWPDAGKAVPGGDRHLHTARIGVADILRGDRQQTSRDIERIAAGGDNARVPVKRRIRR